MHEKLRYQLGECESLDEVDSACARDSQLSSSRSLGPCQFPLVMLIHIGTMDTQQPMLLLIFQFKQSKSSKQNLTKPHRESTDVWEQDGGKHQQEAVFA